MYYCFKAQPAIVFYPIRSTSETIPWLVFTPIEIGYLESDGKTIGGGQSVFLNCRYIYMCLCFKN